MWKEGRKAGRLQLQLTKAQLVRRYLQNCRYLGSFGGLVLPALLHQKDFMEYGIQKERRRYMISMSLDSLVWEAVADYNTQLKKVRAS